MKKILFIVGSLRRESFNRQMARQAEALLAGQAQVSYLDYADIPHLNQDIEYPAPEAIARVRAEVAAADGLWIFSPEYNHSYPGVLKNLLDWLSRPLQPGDYASPTAISGKKLTLCAAAGKSAGAGAVEHLLPLLQEMLHTDIMPAPLTTVALSPDDWAGGRLTLSPERLDALATQARSFLRFIGPGL